MKNKLMIIEDDIEQRNYLKVSLAKKLNLEPICVESAEEAGIILKTRPSDVEVILTDINLPGANGVEFIKSIQQTHPEIHFIIMSGMIASITGIDQIRYGGHRILEKPFKISKLVNVIESFEGPEVKPGFNPIEITDILSYKSYPYDLYIFLNKDKGIKLFPKDETIDMDRLQSYIDKGYKKLYISIESINQTKLCLYIPLRVSTLNDKNPIMFDILQQTQDGEYSVAIPKGAEDIADRLANIKKSNIKKLYILDSDEPQYQAYLELGLKSMIQDTKISDDEKAGVIQENTTRNLKEAYNKPNAQNIQTLKESQKTLVAFIDTNPKAINSLLGASKSGGNDLYQHCLNVASMSYGLALEILRAKKFKGAKIFDNFFVEEADTKEILFMAGLLHETGKIQVLKDYKDKMHELNSMTEKERITAFVTKTNEMIKNIPNIHPKVVEIILQHQEYADGSGAPFGISKNKTSYFAQIVSLINYFDTLVTLEQMPHKAALEQVQDNEEKFNKHLIPLLKDLVVKLW